MDKRSVAIGVGSVLIAVAITDTWLDAVAVMAGMILLFYAMDS